MRSFPAPVLEPIGEAAMLLGRKTTHADRDDATLASRSASNTTPDSRSKETMPVLIRPPIQEIHRTCRQKPAPGPATVWSKAWRSGQKGQYPGRLCIGKACESASQTRLVHVVPKHTLSISMYCRCNDVRHVAINLASVQSRPELGIIGQRHAFGHLGDFQLCFASELIACSFQGLPESMTADGS